MNKLKKSILFALPFWVILIIDFFNNGIIINGILEFILLPGFLITLIFKGNLHDLSYSAIFIFNLLFYLIIFYIAISVFEKIRDKFRVKLLKK